MKSAIAVTEQNRHIAAVRIGGREIEFAVVIEIGGDDRIGCGADRTKAAVLKRPVAVTGIDVDVIVALHRDRQIGFAVAVEVADRNRNGMGSGRKRGCLKRNLCGKRRARAT